MPDPTDEQVVTRGTAKTVAFAIDADGNMPARDFLAEEGKHGPSKSERAGLLHLFQVMAQQGRIHNEEHFTKERGEIFGFKKYQARVAAFQIEDVWYLTHGFKKKRDKWPEVEFTRAIRIRDEYLKRIKGVR